MSSCSGQVHYIQGCTEGWSVVFCAPSHHIIFMSYIQVKSCDVCKLQLPQQHSFLPVIVLFLQADSLTCKLHQNINLSINCCLSVSISWLCHKTLTWNGKYNCYIHCMSPSQSKTSQVPSLNMVSKTLILTAIHWTKNVDPQLTGKWNDS
jgi:hypothetical protein